MGTTSPAVSPRKHLSFESNTAPAEKLEEPSFEVRRRASTEDIDMSPDSTTASNEEEPSKEAMPLHNRLAAHLEKANSQLMQLRTQALIRVKDPQFQTLTLSTASGAVTFSCAGGAFGLASGIVVGSAGGVVPALLTFGLSIPVGAIFGGSTGLILGAGTGAINGSLVGYEVYVHRDQLKDGMIHIKAKAMDTAHTAKVNVCNAASVTTQKLVDGTASAKVNTCYAFDFAKTKVGGAVSSASTKAIAVGKDPTFQVTSASAFAGGIFGGVVGSTVGTVTGAAIGLVPAVFTFGLSIPVGATMGLCTGAFAGSTTGAVGGGALGYGGFTHRKQLNDGAMGVWSKMSTSAAFARTRAADSASQLRDSMTSLVRGSTGETA